MSARVPLPFAVSFLLASPAGAQATLHVFETQYQVTGEHLGAAVARLGDTDDDGVSDLAVGAPDGASSGGFETGAVHVYSGRTGVPRLTLGGIHPGSRFGTSVSGAGDVDGDGRADVLVGAPGEVHGGGVTGGARLYSGATADPLLSWTGPEADTDFASAVSGAGDVDGDGIPDVIVGASRASNNGFRSGSAYVYSGSNGALLYRFDGAERFDEFGRSVSAAGDVNADGRADLLVGAKAGYVRVYSGLDGSVLYSIAGEDFAGFFGHAVSEAGDLNHDGYDDFAASEPLYSLNLHKQGRVRVFSGLDGSTLLRITGTEVFEHLGIALDSCPDVDGDGTDDVIAGTLQGEVAYAPTGYALVYSGADGSELFELEGTSDDDSFGWAVAGLGDVNADGLGDFLAGAPSFDTLSDGRGEARLFLSGCPEPERYCYAGANSTGIGAPLSHTGGPSIVVNNFKLTVTQAPPSKVGIFVYGSSQAQTVFGDGFLCVGGSFFRLGSPQTISASGTASRLVDFTQAPAGSGPGQIFPASTWHFQFQYRDPNGPLGSGFNFSDALKATFVP